MRIAVFALIAALAGPARGGLPVAVRSVEGGFEARFPSTPEPTARDAAGRKLHALAATRERGTSFTLVWSDHVLDAVRAPDAVCRAEVAGLAPAGALRLRDDPASLAGLDGRAIEAVLPDGRELRSRVAMRGVRVFVLLVTGAPGTVDRDADAFFLSFALHGEGVPDPPAQAATRRVALWEARASVELEGLPQPEAGSGEHGILALRVVSRGGLRLQRVYFLPAPIAPAGHDELLLGAVADSLGRAGAKVRERRELTYRRRAARDVRLSGPREDVFLRAIVLDDGALTLVLSGTEGTVTWKEAAAFFDSVRFDGAVDGQG
jgi:hypothetical protein